MIHPTQSDVGRKVIYHPQYPGAPKEYGRISSVRENKDGSYTVWVRYGLNGIGEATPLGDLHWDG